MYVENGNLDVARSLFINNSADVNGGVMYTNISRTTYIVRLSSFVNNTAGDSGGVIFVGRADSLVQSLVSVGRSSFGYNSAGNRGGVIAIIGSGLVIRESNMFNNTAPLGEVISACNSAVTVPSELAGAQDPNDPVCMLYDGFINRFNIGREITTSQPDRNGSHCSNFPSVYIIVPLVMVLLLLQLVCVF